jgi:hypothetical protein
MGTVVWVSVRVTVVGTVRVAVPTSASGEAS